MDYRNAVKWYQWDPTKWFIVLGEKLGLASHLKTFPDGEVQKSIFTMTIKRLKKEQDSIQWPPSSEDLPVVDWETCTPFINGFTTSGLMPFVYLDKEQARNRRLVLISGFIHDVEEFSEDHPGGVNALVALVGKDATCAFFGGTYEHSNAAHNVSVLFANAGGIREQALNTSFV